MSLYSISCRDFVVGDIHGCFHILDAALKDVNFSDQDRLFSVGDLADRGPQSHRCLEFLQKANFFPVLGNHEIEFLSLFHGNKLVDWDEKRQLRAAALGMEWVKQQDLGLLLKIRQAYRQLPLAIRVQTARGSVGIVHADIPKAMGWSKFVKQLKLFNETVWDEALNGRQRLNDRDDFGVMGIDRIYMGHTPQQYGIRRLGNCYFIDTYACGSDKALGPHLSLVNLETSSLSLEEAGITVCSYQIVDDVPDYSFTKRSRRYSSQKNLFTRIFKLS